MQAIGALSYAASAPVIYATWDPAAIGTNIVLSGGNLTQTSAGTGEARATKFVASGDKRYWEVTSVATSSNAVIGVDNGSGNLNGYTGQNNNTWGDYGDGVGAGVLHNSTLIGSGFVQYFPGDIIGVALDLVGNTVQFYKNGVANGSAIALPAGNYYPAAGAGSFGVILTANFGATAISGVPAGSGNPPAGFTTGVY